MLRGSGEEVSEPAEQPGFTIYKPKLACPGPLAFWHHDLLQGAGPRPVADRCARSRGQLAPC
jgi:hypothetical protein